MHHWTSCWGPGRKDPPVAKQGKIPDNRSISCNLQQLWISWQKSPPPPVAKQWNKSEAGSIHFMQFPATLVQLAEKPPPPFVPFHERPSSHCTCRIPMVPILQIHTQIPPTLISSLGYQLSQLFKILTYTEVQDSPQWPKREKNLRLNLSVSCNFLQLWLSWQKSPPVAKEGKNSENESIRCMQYPATLVQLAEKPLPSGQRGKNSETESIHFMQFPATLVQLAEKPPFLPFCERPGLHCTCGIPMVPILQIHTQIPPIRISSLGYQLCQLFKIL